MVSGINGKFDKKPVMLIRVQISMIQGHQPELSDSVKLFLKTWCLAGETDMLSVSETALSFLQTSKTT